MSALARLATLQLDVQNFALVTHAVPAERVRPHVPDMFDLQTFSADDGREMVLVSANGFCNRQVHLAPFRYPAHDFDQVTFRTYVRHRDVSGAYFFGTYVNTRLSYVGQISVAKHTWMAEIEADIDLGPSGYPSYVYSAKGPKGTVAYRLEATEAPEPKHPFTTGEELAQFITYRLHGYTKHGFGFQIHGPIEHRRMNPFAGRLLEGRFDFWAEMGILEEHEFEDVYSVLIEPSVHFTLYPPRPARR